MSQIKSFNTYHDGIIAPKFKETFEFGLKLYNKKLG